ncbi:hypothetical protein BCR41DRAFT_426923 [Lobosporangium transversale]|uniref:Uncharacterized protein n=1 Tax=Lobosporangium transversale TaxID=64571 RepID=A0A1Y2G5B1_9FUNG|nr:hypothetical protein BCR41DRAFT_426923 [Lobosporangium transversale]ORY94358.1 hypothetical protein BCR41DRAFT_426923 [Lobosporangium transversale]|eukprot:XP_021875298.1 hypothetical protein BCR41DRAFT_426923 [Lobosporangium transversale]
MTKPQYQQFQKTNSDIIEEVCVRTVNTSASNDNSSCFVSLQDIRDVFPDALRFKLDGHPIPFLLDDNGNRIEPPRIAFYPDRILDVIAGAPQSCNCVCNCESSSSSSSNAIIRLPTLKQSKNLDFQDLLWSLSNIAQPSNSFLTIRNNEDFNSHLEEIKGLLLEAKNRDNEVIKLQSEMLKLQLEAKEKNDEVLKLQLEAREKSDEVVKVQLEMRQLQLEAKEKDDKMLEMQKETLNLQQQVLDRLAILQQKVEAILIQSFELHEYPIPRLFIILPIDRTKWDPMNILRNKVRLHFLCEHGIHAVNAAKSCHDQIHLARHEGYEIRESTEFFQKYGKYMTILLQCLSMGMPLAASLGSVPDLKAGIDHSLNYMKALSVEYPALNSINTIEDYEALEGADLRGLSKFLQINDEDGKLGNLYRTTTEGGHVKWVCVDHYRSTYKEKEQKAFEGAVEMNGGKYDSQLGKVTVELGSRIRAAEFFDALTKAKHIYELDITLNWDWTKTDLEAIESALRVSSVSILRLDLGSPQEGIARKLLSTTARYERLVRIIELNTMKVVRIALPSDLIKLSRLPT